MSDGAVAEEDATVNKPNQTRILSAREYNAIRNFVVNFNGLAIDCELLLRQRFGNIDRMALKSILQEEFVSRYRSQFRRYESKGKHYLQIFEMHSAQCSDPSLLIQIAIRDGLNPVALCRTILQEKYNFENKLQLSRLIKYPHLIDDYKLAANVAQCLCSDSQDGPLIDLRRRLVGEEYEFKLKNIAKSVGLNYYDENDLRRMGYDKTPDMKMIIPFLYKGEVVNWIESKALFGDIKTHKRYSQTQLNSYCNRFGPGIIIYWFGYHEDVPNLPENSIGITVLDDFPSTDNIQFMTLLDGVASSETKNDDQAEPQSDLPYKLATNQVDNDVS